MKVIKFIKKYKLEFIFTLIVLATRVPFVSKILYNWDSVQFALALEKFDVGQHQPHPPGYILYIGLGKLLNYVIGNPNYVFIAISVIATVVATILFYHLCKLIFQSENFSFWATLVFIFNPFIWFYGEVALTYIFDTLFALAFAYLAILIIRKSDVKHLYLLAFLLAMSGGFRQSLMIVFAPLGLFCFLVLLKRKKISIKNIVMSSLVIIFTVAVWMLPLVLLTDGWSNYWDINNSQYDAAANTSSVFRGVGLSIVYNNFKNIAGVTLALLNILLITPILLIFNLRDLKKILNVKLEVALFVLIIVPSYFVYIFIHFGRAGYLMTVAPSLIIIFLVPVYLFYKRYGYLRLVSLVIIGTGIFSFTLISSSNFGSNTILKINEKIRRTNSWYSKYTYGELYHFTKNKNVIFDEIRKYDSEKTVLVVNRGFDYRPGDTEAWVPSSAHHLRHLEYYLPEYDLYEIYKGGDLRYFRIKDKSELKLTMSGEIDLSENIENIIIVSDNIDRDQVKENDIEAVKLDRGQKIYIIEVGDEREVNYWEYKFIKN